MAKNFGGRGCGNKILESSISIKKLWKLGSTNLAYVVPKLAKVWHNSSMGTLTCRKCCETRPTLILEPLVE